MSGVKRMMRMATPVDGVVNSSSLEPMGRWYMEGESWLHAVFQRCIGYFVGCRNDERLHQRVVVLEG